MRQEEEISEEGNYQATAHLYQTSIPQHINHMPWQGHDPPLFANDITNDETGYSLEY